MKKALIVLTIVIVCLVISASGFLAYMGVFTNLTVREAEYGPYYMLYTKHTGPYEELGPVFKAMRKFVEDRNIKAQAMFGLYYDDPEKTDKSKLRSEIGAVLNRQDFNQLRTTLQTENIHFKSLPRQSYTTTEFPFRNILSIYIGVYKAYPALREYQKAGSDREYVYKEKNYEDSFAMELYQGEQIRYLLRVSR